MNQRIVCAANRNPETGEIVIGVRHGCPIMRWNILSRRPLWMKLLNKWCKDYTEQGFIDQHGNFHNRQEAWAIAEKQGQIMRRVGGDTSNGGTLYSENLY